MKDISWYWRDKEDRANTAQAHTAEMLINYGAEIENSVNSTIIYGQNVNFKILKFKLSKEEIESRYEDMKIILTPEDSVTALLQHHEGKTTVLNFASYKNAGGGFMNGSKAQEESLCHESFLYNVLRRKTDYYNWNNAFKNKGLYLNRALYSPNIIFERDTTSCMCDVITCAAPNYGVANKYCHVSKAVNTKVLSSRIEFVLDIAATQKVDTLILGAFGCGVFQQDATEVATLFKEFLQDKHKHSFKNVYFAIPIINNDSNNYDDFIKVFSENE